MKDLTQIEHSDLYDLLAQQTNRYMKMLSEGATKQEFDYCRETIVSIQAEIRARKSQKSPNIDGVPHNSLNPAFLNRPGT